MTWIDDLAALGEQERAAVIASMPPADAEALTYSWEDWRRPNQTEPSGDWTYWLILAGRGFGKTRMGAEWVRARVKAGYHRVNLLGATADDARDIMIEGESGILAVCPPAERPIYRKTLRRLDWPNGASSLVFTADEPDRLRGKQHDALWCDELAAWRKLKEAWTQAKLGLRLGPRPQAIITTTPKPRKVLKAIAEDPDTAVTTGTTYDNRANLAPAFFDSVIREYEGTSVGRQELLGHMLSEAEGALWRREWLDRHRVDKLPETVLRVAVGVDPPGGATECGIVAAALGEDDHVYVFADASEQLSAGQWGAKVWRTALVADADVAAGERNFGGDMVEQTLKTAAQNAEFEGEDLPRFESVNASRGKSIRAEPWAAKTEQGRLHIVGELDELEDELCTWDPTAKPRMPSPNRLDAMVWACAALSGPSRGATKARLRLR